MEFTWCPETEKKFRKKLELESGPTYRSIFLFAIPFFGAFSIVDWAMQPLEYRLLTVKIRLTTVLFLIPLYFLTKKPGPSSLIPTLLVGAITLSVTLMACVSNGYQSPYFFGISLLIFLMPQIFAWSPKKVALHTFTSSFFYIGAVLINAHFIITDTVKMAEVCVYLLSSSIIAVWGTVVSDGIRRQSYSRYIDAQDARDRIERTVKILQSELHLKNDDPVSLSKELANRTSELQEEVWSEQEAKARIAQALNTRDEFISIASHELKTPITVMKLQSWLLKKYLAQIDVGKTHPGILAFVERNDAQIKRLLRLVDDMLDLSRIRTGTFRLEPEKVELCALVRELVERYQPQFSTAGIEAKVVACDEATGVWDRLRLEQVISNLFNNAIKYASRAPLEVRVSHVSENEILLEIHDHGPGISAAHREKIFDRFERGSADAAVSGLGLGLYISRQIIRSHGGEILIDENPAEGACFKVKLPTLSPAAAG